MSKKSPQAKSPPKPYQVFVSHATADKWLAKTICQKVESAGATTFRDDRDIDGGDDIPEEIRRQIKQSKEIRFFRCKVQTPGFSGFPPAPSWLLFL